MKRLLIIVMLLLIPVIGLSQDFRFVSWQEVNYLSEDGALLRYDKLEHLVGSFGLAATFSQISAEHGWKYALLCGFIWEIKDGLMDYEIYGEWGGEGCDLYGDFVADGVGIALWNGLGWIWDAIFGGGGDD